MKRSPRSLLAATLALAVIALSAAGCARKVAVDQLGRLLVPDPEGTRDSLERTPSDLVIWPDVPNLVTEGSTTYPVYRTGPGAIQGVILDYVQSSGYVMFRGEGMHDSAGVAARGGYRQFSDFLVQPYRRWADRNYYAGAQGPIALEPAQAFAFSDASPTSDSLKVYLGRSVIAGQSSRNHPLTNRGQTGSASTMPELVYTGTTSPPDSLIPLLWNPVPGASGYWVHIFNTFQRRKVRDRSGDDAIKIGLPSPLARGGDFVMVRDFFIAYFPASVTAYTLGDPLPPGSRVLLYRVLPGKQPVRVRVSAVDARGRMIATIGAGGVHEDFLEPDGSRLRKFPAGVVIVTPKR